MTIPIDRTEHHTVQAWEYMTFDLGKPKKDIDDLNRLGRVGVGKRFQWLHRGGWDGAGYIPSSY